MESVDSSCLPEVIGETRASYGYALEDHYEAVLGFLGSLCREEELARDLTQEAYLRAYAHLARHPHHVERPREWLLTIARCAFIDRVRYEAVRPAMRVESLDFVEDPAISCADEAAAIREDGARLGRAIEDLPSLTKALLVGFHLNGEDFACLARRHGLNRSAARVRVFRARQQLRRRLG